MNCSNQTTSSKRSTIGAVAFLSIAFAILVWPIVFNSQGKLGEAIADSGYATSELGDQRKHHEHVIAKMAEQWPDVDIVDYSSATSPGYHLIMSFVARFVSQDLVILQFASSIFSLVLILVVWRYSARLTGPWPAALLTLPILFSSYFLGAAIWLTTDNAGLLFVVLALGGSVFVGASANRIVKWGLFSAVAVYIRQIHIWVIAPVVLVALLTSGANRFAPKVLQDAEQLKWRLPQVAFTAIVLMLPLAILGVLVYLWGGLTPSHYAQRHNAGFNLATFPLILSLFGAFGIFFLPILIGAGSKELLIGRSGWIAICLGIVIAVIIPTSHDFDAGRWGGSIWTLVEYMPDVAGRSIVFPPLAAIGCFVLLSAWRALRNCGRSRQAAILLLALLGWAIAQSANSQAWQRYCEPIILISLAWMAAMTFSTQSQTQTAIRNRNWWVGPALLSAIQLGLSIATLYLPVFKS
ncbi:MAG: hypothetical protein IH984_06240 [Planctomycetes bacterium]|nr:hypothetical protein [Planctomycetota bacterium]